ncbi:MAG TPA: Amuc_1099 family pilus-like system protein, partial [Chthoniobacterales bacterium]|nr:Amuc_1099 family pilus-like system protein [Chthoniobacterales bacterium]
MKRFCIAIAILALATLSYSLCKNALAFYHAEQTYHAVAKKLAALTFSVEYLQKAEGATVQEKILVQELVDQFQKYQISLPKDLRQLTPALFQDHLRHDVSEVKEKAIEAPITLPEDFFLGLNQYENIPPPPQELEKAIEQEILLCHIATKILEHPRLKLEQFELQESSEKKKRTSNSSSYITPLGTLLINFTTDERAFQKLFNDIVENPYLYIIESMSVENSNPTPPPHETLTYNAEPLTGTNSIFPMKLLLGNEQLTVTMRLQLLNFAPPLGETTKKLPSLSLSAAKDQYLINPSVECTRESTNQQTASNCAYSNEPQLPSSISHLPSPTAAAVSTIYSLQPPTTVQPVGQIITQDLSWISPSNDTFFGVPLFTSRHYFLHQGKLIDPIEAKIQLHPPVPNEWLLKNHLDITDPNILSRDNDHDGFTNLEEWLGSNPYSAPGTES